MLTALKFLRMVLGKCINKPLIVVDRGSWYRWALERLGLKYRYQRFGLRNRMEDYTAATAIIRNIITIIKTKGRITWLTGSSQNNI
jgi:transposase-like protein